MATAHINCVGRAGGGTREDTVGTQAAICSKTAESSQKDNASGFPTVLWESPGMKPPGLSQPGRAALGTHQAQAKGQLKIVCLANRT